VRITLVLGAGASLANAAHFRPVRGRGSHPPLDYTFFERIRQLGIAVPHDLLRYASNLPTGNPFEAGGPSFRMEAFFRDSFFDFLETGATDTHIRDAYLQLVDVYTRVIRETSNWMTAEGYAGGPVGRLIASAAEAADQVDIVTFNHDLVIENEIFKRARLRQRWCLDQGYGSFSSGRQLVNSSLAMFPAHGACDHSRPITIHKLHGSLNWLVKIRGRDPTHSVLTGTSSGSDVMVSRQRAIPGALRIRTGKGPGRHTWYTWPVIVPPIYGKHSLIRTFMPAVWEDARDALRQSDRVVFFGYSMPSADIEAEKLVQRTIALNGALPWIGVVDPSPATAMRFIEAMPSVPLRRYADADSFLSSIDWSA